MPRVGRKRFSYTPSGRAKARRESIRSGIPVSNSGGYENTGRRGSSIRTPIEGGGTGRLRSSILKRLKRGNKRTY